MDAYCMKLKVLSGYEPDTIASVAAGVITITIMNNQNVSDLQGFQVINEGSKFGNLPGNRDSGVHQGHTGRCQNVSVALQPVITVWLKSFAFDVFLRTIDRQLDRDNGDQRFALIL